MAADGGARLSARLPGRFPWSRSCPPSLLDDCVPFCPPGPSPRGTEVCEWGEGGKGGRARAGGEHGDRGRQARGKRAPAGAGGGRRTGGRSEERASGWGRDGGPEHCLVADWNPCYASVEQPVLRQSGSVGKATKHKRWRHERRFARTRLMAREHDRGVRGRTRRNGFRFIGAAMATSVIIAGLSVMSASPAESASANAISQSAAAIASGAQPSGSVCAVRDCPLPLTSNLLRFSAVPLAAAARHTRDTSLTITITGLPTGLEGFVIARKTHGRTLVIKTSTTINPADPGRWKITARPVLSGDTTYYPTTAITTVRLAPGAAGKVSVDYGSAVANTTRVASAGAIQSVTPPDQNGDQVVVVNDPGHTLAPGDTLDAGAGPATPEGLILDVTAVTRLGSVATVTGTAGSLTDIGPQGDITASGSYTDPQSFDDPLTCSGAASASISGSIDFSPQVQLDMTWGGLLHPGTITARATVSGTETASLAANVNGTASCTYETDLLPQPVVLGIIGVLVGPVPVVVVPKLNFELEADASIAGSLDTSITQSLAMAAGLNWDGNTLTPFSSLTPTHSYQPLTQNGSGSVHAQVGPIVTINIQSIPGPFISADANTTLQANLPGDLPAGSTNTPCWTLTAGLEAGGGLKFNVWGISFDKEDPSILSQDWPVAADPCITTGTLDDATLGNPYTDTLQVMGGSGPPYSWAITSGSLPDGLDLDASSGEISGTPTLAGSFTFEVMVSDTNGDTATATLELTVAGNVSAAPTATITAPASGATYAQGASAPTSFSCTAGTGSTLSSCTDNNTDTSGVNTSGTLNTSVPGSFNYTVTATDADGKTGTASITYNVSAAPTATITAPASGATYAQGASAPTSFSCTAGTGSTLSSCTDNNTDTSGVNTSGTLNTSVPGSFTYTVTATDADGKTGTASITYNVSAAPTATITAPASGATYAQGASAPTSFSCTAGTGSTLSSCTDNNTDTSGVNTSGTLNTSVPGSFTYTVTATDADGKTGTASITYNVSSSSTPDCSVPPPPADLAGADLQGCDLAGADLDGADLDGANLGVLYPGTPFASDTDLAGANLSDANMTDANMTDAQLEGADLDGANLTGADLTDTYLNSANLTGANLTGANLTGCLGDEADLTDADLTDANLTDANLYETPFTDATLTGADLTDALLSGDLSGGIIGTPSALPTDDWEVIDGYLIGPTAQLTDADLSDADLSDADLEGANLTEADLTGANLSDANLSEADLNAADLNAADLTGASLTDAVLEEEANLTGADLTGADLTYAGLEEADLTGADLTDATLTDATLSAATLSAATLTGADLSDATLEDVSSGDIIGTPSALPTDWESVNGYLIGPEANLTSANLTGANLTGADLSDADLSDADLTGANLSDADLSDANLSDANLTGANLTGANLTGAFWFNTGCPDGTNSGDGAGTCLNDL